MRLANKLFALAGSFFLLVSTASAQLAPGKVAIVIHGGAGTILKKNMTPETEAAYREKLTEALNTGYQILLKGGSSVDAVEATLRVMEDSPLFNAGKGAVFTAAGTNELDAAIMDGKTLKAGSVAGLHHVKNPISLARRVMDRSRHVMMIGDGAEIFAKEQGLELVAPHYFWTERRWQSYEKSRDSAEKAKAGIPSSGSIEGDKKYGTVGAVALDQNGNLAAGTTTGGINWKEYGRVGDAPIIGAGTYANNESCAVSATGQGEIFIRRTVASDICARVKYLHQSVSQAANDVIMKELVPVGGEGGVIAMDARGNIATPFNSAGMYRGWVSPEGKLIIKIFRDE
jgi:beta-aspartyl-peptidase (threonine type)